MPRMLRPLLAFLAVLSVSATLLGDGSTHEQNLEDAAQLFAALDADQNGWLDGRESKGLAPEALVWFAKNGTNWNEGISRDEFLTFAPFMLQSMHFGLWDGSDVQRSAAVQLTNAGPVTEPPESVRPVRGEVRRAAQPGKAPFAWAYELPPEYQKYDRDGDDQIGLYEWPRGNTAAFKGLDVNGDGFVTPDEVRPAAAGAAVNRRQNASAP